MTTTRRPVSDLFCNTEKTKRSLSLLHFHSTSSITCTTLLHAATSGRVMRAVPPAPFRTLLPPTLTVLPPAVCTPSLAAASRAEVMVALPHAGGGTRMWRATSAWRRPVDGASRVSVVAGDLKAGPQGEAAAASATDARPKARSVSSRVRHVGQRPHEIYGGKRGVGCVALDSCFHRPSTTDGLSHRAPLPTLLTHTWQYPSGSSLMLFLTQSAPQSPRAATSAHGEPSLNTDGSDKQAHGQQGEVGAGHGMVGGKRVIVDGLKKREESQGSFFLFLFSLRRACYIDRGVVGPPHS